MMDRLLKAVASLLRHCGQEECAETDFEKAVVEARDALADALLARSATDAIPDVRLDGDGMLDEICADNVHLERLDRNYWFLSVAGGGKEVAAWLSSSPTFEWREGSPRSEAEPTADARDAAGSVPVWPKEKTVGRMGEMAPKGDMNLHVHLQDDGDVIVGCWEVRHGTGRQASVEFCTVGPGGGRSPRTRAALIALMVAIEGDNAETPERGFPPRERTDGGSK